jgi:hypothetical protein
MSQSDSTLDQFRFLHIDIESFARLLRKVRKGKAVSPKDSDPKSSWPIPILLLVTLAGGYLFTQSPLKSFRPFHESVSTPLPNTEQQVPARLWQGPLEAVMKYNAKPHPDPISTERMKSEIEAVTSSSELTVVVTTLDNSPYSEGRETRTRVRYVVGAALNHVCYVPENAESIGLRQWPPSPKGSRGRQLALLLGTGGLRVCRGWRCAGICPVVQTKNHSSGRRESAFGPLNLCGC